MKIINNEICEEIETFHDMLHDLQSTQSKEDFDRYNIHADIWGKAFAAEHYDLGTSVVFIAKMIHSVVTTMKILEKSHKDT